MSPVLETTAMIAYGLLLASMAMAIWRLAVGPSLADRVVALDFIALVFIGFIGVTALVKEQYAYLDVGIALALVAFLSTVALARYIFRRAERNGEMDVNGSDISGRGRVSPPAQEGQE